MPSSTSNSDIDYRSVPEQPWSKLVLIALVLLIIAMGFWESLARKMYHAPGSYDGLGHIWADQRRKLDAPDNDVRIILSGSSRILWAADLDILQQGFGTRPLQLALPGTSPALIVEDVVNNTDFDGLIIVGVTPFLFNWIDEGFAGGLAFDRYHNLTPSQWSGNQLHRILSDYLGFLDEAFDLFSLLERYTNFADRDGVDDLKMGDWKLGNTYEDGQTDMWEPVEEVGSFDNQQILNFWTPGLQRKHQTPEEMAKTAEDTITFFEPLVSKLRERGGDMIFIRMPSRGAYLDRDIETNHRELMWEPMVEGFGAPSLNTFDYPFLSTELEIPEWSHLSRKSQDDWSRDVVPVIEEVYEAFREAPLSSVIAPANNP